MNAGPDDELATAGTDGTVQALHRGLLVLEALAASGGDTSLAQLAARFPWHKSTTLRMLATLIQHGQVEQDPETRLYRLGMGILTLSSALGRRLNLRELSRQTVRGLAERTRENAHIAILDHDEAVVLEQSESLERIRSNTEVGMRMPCHCTALGKVLLAWAPEEQVDRLLEGGELGVYTDRTRVAPAEVKAMLAEVRQQGYAAADLEFDGGTSCLAAPIRNHEGRVVASVGISGPHDRLHSRNYEGAIAAVVAAGLRISERLGYCP
ncbi:MAG: IclR family transcriptional regulator [Candidatus Latescibacterota bacterium]